ncbi:MAG TPA: GxxExxY protein [Edaphobacter sp.]|jgi:GxxExxY protein|nr:GxxExxY protein [Edaphobacter sp.]
MSTDSKAKTDERRDGRGRASFHGLHAEITERVIGVFFEVYNELGGGFLEGVYQEALRIALVQAGMEVEAEVPVPVNFRGVVVGSYRADLVVNHCVLLELKAISSFDSAHDGQVLHYLRATKFEVGLLLNFGPKPQFRRFILEEEKKKIRAVLRESAVEALRDS